MHITLAALAEKIGATVVGDATLEVSSLASLEDATSGQISFITDASYLEHLKETAATAVILDDSFVEYAPCSALVLKNPYLGFALVAQLFDTTPKIANGIAESAVIASDARLGDNVSIGANAVIESGVVLGDNVEIGAGCFIGKNTSVGNNSRLWANVTLYHQIKIGEHCLIHSGSVIGADGFGYANDKGKWIKIPQLGSVRIGNHVEIGALTTVDRGALNDTIISDNVIIDDHCHLGHNVEIGTGTAVAGAAAMAGSLKIGKYCMIGGASVLNGHMSITDHVNITGMAMVAKPITEPGTYSSGLPLQTNMQWRRTATRLLKIEEYYKRLKQLEKETDILKGSNCGQPK